MNYTKKGMAEVVSLPIKKPSERGGKKMLDWSERDGNQKKRAGGREEDW